MASPSKKRKAWLDVMLQGDQSSSSRTEPSGDASRQTAGTPRSAPDVDGPQTHSQDPVPALVPNNDGTRTLPQNPAPSVMVPTAATGLKSEMRSTPRLRYSASEYPMIARYARSVSKAEADRKSPMDSKPQKMPYPANAIPPETPEELSIYPVGHGMQKIPVAPEESTYPDVLPSPWNNWSTEFSLQHQVRKEVQRLYLQKQDELLAQPGPVTATLESTGRLDQDTRYRSDKEKSGGGPKSHENTRGTREVLLESVDWDEEADLDRDFSMFEDTPRDQSILPEKEEWTFEPPDPEHAPSLSALSSMTEWDPEADLDFLIDAQWNLERWNDFRFKVPETPADQESLQQALEMTRMDFWIRNLRETYPEDLSKYRGESYGSQHRRLQHAFCRIWRDFDCDSAPELYRLPSWMFGFEYCYWKPSTWGYDRRSRAYNQGLAEMSAEKNEKGLCNVDYRNWKAKLEDILNASPVLEDWC